MIDSLVKTILSEIKQVIQNETVVGKPIQAGAVTLIPVSRISIGFGAGGGRTGQKHGEAEGTGGGLSVEPVAFLAVQDKKVDLIPIKAEGSELARIINLIPGVAEKIKDVLDKKDEKSNEPGKEKT
jgi:uncharacterized spore protein YtfJ